MGMITGGLACVLCWFSGFGDFLAAGGLSLSGGLGGQHETSDLLRDIVHFLYDGSELASIVDPLAVEGSLFGGKKP